MFQRIGEKCEAGHEEEYWCERHNEEGAKKPLERIETSSTDKRMNDDPQKTRSQSHMHTYENLYQTTRKSPIGLTNPQNSN